MDASPLRMKGIGVSCESSELNQFKDLLFFMAHYYYRVVHLIKEDSLLTSYHKLTAETLDAGKSLPTTMWTCIQMSKNDYRN